ncbi:MAG TPA: phosphocholine cytidylyltransferase family protein [Parachlamydiaceae bacterium]|nr:phosphocholine cytidylyltransferase family protein [Parachlamydiaceae bacterium]
MKVIILAAGKGSRLNQGDLPKPLTKLVDGQSILAHQLENLSLYISLKNVIVVVGYHKEAIMELFPDLLYVYNPHFSQENTSKSLLRALEKCEEDVLWINGDVVFHPLILKSLFAHPKTSMVVNVGKVGEEEVKYRMDSKGKILEVSKKVEGPEGEALGINFVGHDDLDLFRKKLELCLPNDYFERAIEACIEEGMAVWSYPVDHSLCAEIDFPEDLEKANGMLQSWTNTP